MIFDLSNPLQLENFNLRVGKLVKKRCFVELTEKKPQRTNSQNAYLHLILGYFGCQTGYTIEFVKEQFFKKHCNPDLFVSYKDDKLIGRVEVIRSSRTLDTAEMTTAIERFRNWSADNGIYIPAPDEEQYMVYLEQEIERNRNFL